MIKFILFASMALADKPDLVYLNKLEDQLLEHLNKIGCLEYPDSLGCTLFEEKLNKIQKLITDKKEVKK